MGLVISGAKIIEREMRLQSAYEDAKLSHQYVLEMTESLPSGILVVNQKGIVTNINNKACELLKSSKEYFLNQNYAKSLGKLDCIEKTFKYGKAQEESEQHFQRGMHQLHFTMSSRPIMNSQGVLDGAVIILREIEDVIRITNKMAGYNARFTFEDIIGQAPKFISVINQAKSAAATSSNVLLLGESGTGKEMIAQAIHNSSSRCHGPFVAINCGAVPRELIGSELFGYEEGAFTGAKRGGSPGKFELANNGTIFLDEIGDMPLDLQLVLLRVLQDKIVVRLGGHQSINVNVRLIAATNKDLKRQVDLGLFRQDLYYRINVITLNLPPLRERTGDIVLLTDYFLQKKADKNEKPMVSMSSHAIDLLKKYSWPGNVRELENVVERAMVFSNGKVIEAEYLHLPVSGVEIRNSASSLKSEEKEIIRNTLMRTQGNISKTARILGITRATLYRKMRYHNLG
jgi:transcriptional regulator with PAS, ATPase and Fis domain